MLHGTLGSSGTRVAAAGARIVSAAPAIAHAAPLIGALCEPWQTIPLGARVIVAADAFDTLGALDELRRSARFDPDVVTALAAVCETSTVPFVVA